MSENSLIKLRLLYHITRFMGISKRCFTIFTAIFLSLTIASHAQESELKAISFGDEDTEYSLRRQKKGLIIDARGQNSASGLFVTEPKTCLQDSQLSWSWRVDQIQPSANITIEDKEDFAASILVIFGKPGPFSKPQGLIYGFTNTDLPAESVVESPRAPDNFRTIVLANEQSPLKNWLKYKRNILQDYKLAYGEMPGKELYAIGVFTDNDQTKEPVKASYNLESCSLQAQEIEE